MKDRVLLASDFLIHVRDPDRRSRYGRRMTVCDLLVPDGARGSDDAATCSDCRRIAPERAAATPAPESEPEVLDIDVRCAACGETQLEQLVGDMPARDALAAITCQRCGAVGGFAITRRPTEEPRDEQPERRTL